jgi:hypothetical protein
MKPDLYDYIAANASEGDLRDLFRQYGYKVTDFEGLGENLRMLAMENGESVIKAMAKIHPDKDLILEFNKKCGCSSPASAQQNFHASGNTTPNFPPPYTLPQSGDSNKLALQNNALIIVAGMLFAVTFIIIMNKKT